MKHVQLFEQFLNEETKSIPNSIGINSNTVKKALKILDDKGINYKPLNKTIDGFDVYDLGSSGKVVLALAVLQKRGIKVLDTERLDEAKSPSQLTDPEIIDVLEGYALTINAYKRVRFKDVRGGKAAADNAINALLELAEILEKDPSFQGSKEK